MSDLAQKIKSHMATTLADGDPLTVYVAAIRSVLEDHCEFPAGWCVSCGRDYPCVTVRDMAAALGVCVAQPEKD